MAAAKKTTAKTTVNAPEVEQTIQEPIIEPEPEPEPMHQRWEYSYTAANLEALNTVGQYGWEAVNIDGYHDVAWLKRPVL